MFLNFRRMLKILGGITLIAIILPMAAFAHSAPATHSNGSNTHHYNTHIVLYPTIQQVQREKKSNRFAVQGSGDLSYYGGPVQETPVSYIIFWGSSWLTKTGALNPTGQIVKKYLVDMGGTSFDNILTQYYDYNTNIANSSVVKGTWVDKSYPAYDYSCGGKTVEDSSIQNEVTKAISANHWASDGSNATYFVYTPNGYYVNDGAGDCSMQVFCAYHNYSNSGLSYGAMPYPINLSACGVPSSPNGNRAGDSLASVTSHEQFEAITDPQPGSGWVDNAGYEIGDKCAWDFSAGYTYLNNGGVFEIQTEYSNATSSCVNSY